MESEQKLSSGISVKASEKAASEKEKPKSESAALSFPCGRDCIESVLPHRDPFLWLTRVITCDPGVSIEAELELPHDLAVFGGHFPNYPVFPGVLLMEALAQAASFCVLVGQNSQGSIGFLTGIDKAKFRSQIRPGDVVTLTGRITKLSSRMCVAEVEARVGESLCATATQKYVLT